MQYLLLFLAIVSLAMAYFNNAKYRRLKNGGRIPSIIIAHRKAALYLLLSITSGLACIFMMAEMI